MYLMFFDIVTCYVMRELKGADGAEGPFCGSGIFWIDLFPEYVAPDGA